MLAKAQFFCSLYLFLFLSGFRSTDLWTSPCLRRSAAAEGAAAAGARRRGRGRSISTWARASAEVAAGAVVRLLHNSPSEPAAAPSLAATVQQATTREPSLGE